MIDSKIEIYKNFSLLPMTGRIKLKPLIKNLSLRNLDDYICQICFEIIILPVICNSCDQLFCSDCLDISINKDSKCPSCRKDFIKGKINKQVLNLINELEFICHYEDCKEIFKYKDLNIHLDSCLYIIRIAKCNLCSKNFSFSKIEGTDKHYEICEESFIECKSCKNHIKLKSINLHKSMCSERVVVCEFCKIIIKSNDYDDHIVDKRCVLKVIEYYENLNKNNKAIISNLNEKNKKLEEKLKKLKDKGREDDNYILEGHKDSTWSMVCYINSNNEKLLATANFDKTIKIWNLKTNANIKTLYGHTEGVRCITRSKNYLISGSRDNKIKKWDIENDYICVNTFVAHSEIIFDLIVFNYEGESFLASCSRDKEIKIWDMRNLIRTLTGHLKDVTCLLQYQKNLISGSNDHSLKVWEIETGKCINTFIGHFSYINCLKEFKNTILSGSNDKSIKQWNIDGECINTFKFFSGILCMEHFDDNEKYDNLIICGGWNESIKVININNGSIVKELNGHTDSVTSIIIDENIIISGSKDKTIRLWNSL